MTFCWGFLHKPGGWSSVILLGFTFFFEIHCKVPIKIQVMVAAAWWLVVCVKGPFCFKKQLPGLFCNSREKPTVVIKLFSLSQ